MGKFKPIFLALLLNSAGVYLFTAPKGFSCFPFSSYFIFLLAVFFLLWDVKLKPIAFRKLMGWAEFIIEFIVNMMIMEIIMNNFWFPLEMAFLTFLPKIAESIGKTLSLAGVNSGKSLKMFDFLKWHGTLWTASHVLSLFFFLCIIHATRVVDFRILKKCGAGPFIEDTAKRSLAFYSNLSSSTNCPSPCVGNEIIVTQSSAYSANSSYSSQSNDFCECDTSSTCSSS